jgi:vesicular inhibitory amino acid transporter
MYRNELVIVKPEDTLCFHEPWPELYIALTTLACSLRSPMSIRQVGGLNSIDNFARSWQRAAGFWEITPRRPSFVYSSDGAGGESDDDIPHTDDDRHFQRKSLLRQALEQQAAEETVFDYEEEAGVEAHDYDIQAVEEHRVKRKPIARRGGDILSIEPLLASPFGGSYGTSYSTLSSRLGEHSMRHAGRLWQEQQITGAQEPDKEREPLMVKRVELEDGLIVNVVVGQSTVPQTVFNSVNVLVGVGLLSLPLGVRYAGWLIGMTFLLFATIVTHYTARVLVKCLDVDGTLITFADLAYISFGHKARIATSILFTLELVAASVALVVLFADSWDALLPGVGLVQWKIICGFVLMPLSLMPLRVLSFTSILGIVCCFGSGLPGWYGT